MDSVRGKEEQGEPVVDTISVCVCVCVWGWGMLVCLSSLHVLSLV